MASICALACPNATNSSPRGLLAHHLPLQPEPVRTKRTPNPTPAGVRQCPMGFGGCLPSRVVGSGTEGGGSGIGHSVGNAFYTGYPRKVCREIRTRVWILFLDKILFETETDAMERIRRSVWLDNSYKASKSHIHIPVPPRKHQHIQHDYF